MNIATVRSGIASTVASAISGLTCTAYVPDAISEPHFFLAEIEIEYDTTYGGDIELTLTGRVLVSSTDDRASQEKLDAYLSPLTGGLKPAIESWTPTGGADDIRVERATNYRWYEHSGVKYLGAELKIKVI